MSIRHYLFLGRGWNTRARPTRLCRPDLLRRFAPRDEDEKEGAGQLLKKAHTTLMAAKRDFKAEAPNQTIVRAYDTIEAYLHQG